MTSINLPYPYLFLFGRTVRGLLDSRDRRSGGERAPAGQGPVEHVLLQFFHRGGVEAVGLQADDGLVADDRGFGEALAEVQAGGEQPRDGAIVGVLGVCSSPMTSR